MNKYLFVLMILLIARSLVCFAKDEIEYGYDKSNKEIYAKIGDNKKILKFKGDYTGNPSYSFGFLSGRPAIIAYSQSLHDSTVYATLNYSKDKFHIDCLYYNVKSKQNGMLVKEAVCGLNITTPSNYANYIDQKISEIENQMDEIDTSLILNGNVNYLMIVVHRDNQKTLYKLYRNKQLLLDDNYSILSMSNNDDCKTYTNNPWIIRDNLDAMKVEIMSEKINDGQIELTLANPEIIDKNECLSYSAISVKSKISYFYDSSFKVKKEYLIHNDKVNLLSMSSDGKWCRVKYVNNNNKKFDGNLLCSDLKF